jgi:very-short-patch-repair endonuclease
VGRVKSSKPRVEDIFQKVLTETIGFAPVREFRAHSIRRWRWDLAYPSQKLVIDIQGARYHLSAKQNRSDLEKHNAAVEAGYKVLLFPADKIRSPSRVKRCAAQVKRVLFGVNDEFESAEVLTGEL